MLIVIISFAFLFTGCWKDDLSNCPDNSRKINLTVKAYDQNNTELTTDVVKDVDLYLFDSQKRFLKQMKAPLNTSIVLDLSDITEETQFHIVGWGNVSDGKQSFPQPQVGDKMEDCFVKLLTDEASFTLPPTDLFRGDVPLVFSATNSGSQELLLPMSRQTGSLTVTVLGLKEFYGEADDNYSLVVRSVGSSIAFNGTLPNDPVSYKPAGAFSTEGGKEEYEVPIFNILPCDGIFIDIYHGTDLVTTLSASNEGLPIDIKQGELTNVLINLRDAKLDINVSLTQWGEKQLWKEF